MLIIQCCLLLYITLGGYISAYFEHYSIIRIIVPKCGSLIEILGLLSQRWFITKGLSWLRFYPTLNRRTFQRDSFEYKLFCGVLNALWFWIFVILVHIFKRQVFSKLFFSCFLSCFQKWQIQLVTTLWIINHCLCMFSTAYLHILIVF